MIFKLDTFSNLIPVNSFPKNIDFEIKILPDRVHNISRLDGLG